MAIAVDVVYQGGTAKTWGCAGPTVRVPVNSGFGASPVGLVTATDLKHHRWHYLRRRGATQIWAMGAGTQIIMLAGGWESPPMAKGALSRSTPGGSWSTRTNQYRYVEQTGTDSSMETGHQKCGG